jgi:H+-transporting ATPase
VFGIFMTPLGWGWALFVWGYALVWFLVNDRVKLLAYRIFDPTKEPLLAKRPRDLTPQIAARAYELYEERVRGEGQAARDWLEAEREIRKDKPDAKADAPAEPAPDAKADAPAEPAPTVTPRLVERVHDLYQELGREDVRAVQDWEKAQPEDREGEPDA